MPLSEIIKLGDPVLLGKSLPVDQAEIPGLMPAVDRMARLILEFRAAYGRGRAIAAPQIGMLKRIIVINTEKVTVLINPVMEWKSDEMIELWDDCMSFPELLVRLKRHKRIRVSFRDTDWKEHIIDVEDDMSELLQHEYDHLDGILAISKADDISCFRWASP